MNESMEKQSLALMGGQRLIVENEASHNLLRIVSPEGMVSLSIRVTPAGPILHFGGTGLMIQADGDLAVKANRIALHGNEGVAITSGGDAFIDVAGDLHSKARIQNITADLGNVNVKANDDVKINGERVLVNC